MNMLSEHLAENLLALRSKRQITQGQLAKLCSVPRSTIANLESGAGNPTLENLVKVAGALQVSVEELLSPPRANCKLIKSKDLVKTKKGSTLLIRLLPDPIPGMVIDRMEIDEGGRLGGAPHVEGTKENYGSWSGDAQWTGYPARNCEDDRCKPVGHPLKESRSGSFETC